jgi:fermentation-respiration switch protein FrsA (DUF1100 family)
MIYFYIKYVENKSLFFPLSEIEVTPKSVKLPYVDASLKTKDGVLLNGWYLPFKNSKFTILFCHGNAGNIGNRVEKIEMLYKLGLSVFIFDYRGYGKSEGRPSEEGLYLDTEAAYDYLTKDLGIVPLNVVLYGESLGCATAVYLASERKVGAVILEGGFSSVRDVARKYYPFIPSFIISDKFNSLSRIGKIEVPKLFIHGKDDEIIPFKLAVKLFDLAPQPKRFLELVGWHNTVFLDSKEKYLSSVSSFLETLQ